MIMNRKNTYTRSGLLLFIITIMLFMTFTSNICAQEEQEQEKEEGPRLTREAQLAMVNAQELMGKEDNAGALKTLLDFLATGPEFIPETMYLMLGALYYYEENLEESVKAYEKGHNAFPDSENMALQYSVMLTNAQKYDRAAPMFEKVYEMITKKDIKYLINAAKCYYLAEKLEDSKRVFKRLIKMTDPPEKDWYDSIIRIAEDQQNSQEAEGYVMEALTFYPMEVKYWNVLASLRQQQEDIRGTASAYDIATHVKPPEGINQWKILIQLYNYLNVPLRAATKMQKTFDIEKPKEKDHITIANAYVRAMKTDEAVAYLDKVIAKERSVNLMLEKAKILYDARRNKQAIEALDQLLAADPKNEEAYIMKGWVAWDMKEWDAAEDAFEKVINDKDLRQQAKEALGGLTSLKEARE